MIKERVNVIDLLGGESLLFGSHRKHPLDIEKKIREGLPFRSVLALEKNLNLDQVSLFTCLDLSTATWYRVKRSNGKLGMGVSDRAFRLARIYALAMEAFDGDKALATRWLTNKKTSLGNKIPFEMLQTDAGTKEVEDLLWRIEYGLGA